MHTVCRKTKANAFGDFAYDFTEVTCRNLESRKDVCFDTYQNHYMKGATNRDIEARSINHLIQNRDALFWKLGSSSSHKSK